jgi:hypothetical protein
LCKWKRHFKLPQSRNYKPQLKNHQKKIIKKCLTIFHQNIRGLQSKIDSLEITLEEISPHFIILTEHKLILNDFENLHINGFDICSYYTRKKSSGGVVIMANASVKWEPIIVPEIEKLCCDKIFECCLTSFKNGKNKIVLMGVYRSPSTGDNAFLEVLDSALEILTKISNHIIIGGDFNINVLDNAKNQFIKTEFKNVLKRFGFQYYVNFPTRVTDTTSTAIDNFISNISDIDIRAEGIITCLSDHDAQVLTLTSLNENDNIKSITTYSRKFTEENMNEFKKLLCLENWNEVYYAPVNLKYDVFFNTYVLFQFVIS